MSAENVPGYGDDGCCCQESYDASCPPPPPPPPPPPLSGDSGSGSGRRGGSAGCSRCLCTGVLLPDQIFLTVNQKCGSLGAALPGNCVNAPIPQCGTCFESRWKCCDVMNVTGPNTCQVNQATNPLPTFTVVLERDGACSWTYRPPQTPCNNSGGGSYAERCGPSVCTLTISGGITCILNVEINVSFNDPAGPCCSGDICGTISAGAIDRTVVGLSGCVFPGTYSQMIAGTDKPRGQPGARVTWSVVAP